MARCDTLRHVLLGGNTLSPFYKASSNTLARDIYCSGALSSSCLKRLRASGVGARVTILHREYRRWTPPATTHDETASVSFTKRYDHVHSEHCCANLRNFPIWTGASTTFENSEVKSVCFAVATLSPSTSSHSHLDCRIEALSGAPPSSLFLHHSPQTPTWSLFRSRQPPPARTSPWLNLHYTSIVC